MKIFVKKITALLFSLSLLVSQVTSTKAFTTVNYSYDYRNYTSEIETICYDDNYIVSDIVENGKNISLKIDKNFQYIIVNDVPYSFDDYNNATMLQANKLYDENKAITIVEALVSFKPIDKSRLMNMRELDIIVFENDSKTVSPLASYGQFYKVGEYSKKAMTISLASSAIGLIVAFITSGLGFGVTTSYVTGFVAQKITEWAVDKITSDVWYKKYQAVMNSHGTTKERRYMGIKKNSSSKISWNSKYIERTFETQRPIN